MIVNLACDRNLRGLRQICATSHFRKYTCCDITVPRLPRDSLRSLWTPFIHGDFQVVGSIHAGGNFLHFPFFSLVSSFMLFMGITTIERVSCDDFYIFLSAFALTSLFQLCLPSYRNSCIVNCIRNVYFYLYASFVHNEARSDVCKHWLSAFQ